jgi:hypothetical protein
MEKNWTMAYTVAKLYRAELIVRKLQDNEIEALIINKKDSATMSFGNIEIYVEKDNLEAALEIIKETGI